MKEHSHTLWDFFIQHRRFTMVVIIALAVLGLISTMQLPRESEPEIDVPVGVITTAFPGASAIDVEELVTNVIEDKIINIDEAKSITSTSRESVSVVVVEFDANADSAERIDELKEQVDEVAIDLPPEAEDPFVQQVRFSDQAIYTFSMSGPFTIEELKQFADPLKERLERIAGVSRVTISGAPDKEVQVLVDKAKIDSFGISITEITRAIQQANTDIPTGTIETGGTYYNIRLAGRLSVASELGSIPVSTKGLGVVLLSDVATIVDGVTDTATISRLSIDGGGVLPALSFNIFKQTGGNIIDIVDRAALVTEEYAQLLPKSMQFEVVLSTAQFIKDDLSNLVRNGIATVIIVMILLFTFLGWREALLAGLAIPMSFLITFIFLNGFGYTINFISLFALILALGILIDSAIVVVENLHRGLVRGMTGTEAAQETVRNFRKPLLAGTLTTVFAFVPMLLMSGIVGQFVQYIPITISLVLLSSLLVALGFITTIGTTWLREDGYDTQTARFRKRFFGGLRARYQLFLEGILGRRRVKIRIGLALIAGFVLSMMLPITGTLNVALFPDGDQDFMFVDISLPPNTPIEKTAKITSDVEEILTGEKAIQNFSTTIGSASPTDSSGGESGERFAYIFINLKKERGVTSLDLIDTYQPIFNERIDARVSVGQFGEGPPSGAPVEISVQGPDLVVLENITREYQRLVESIPGTRDVKTSIADTTNEFTIRIDRSKAELYGLTTTQVAQTLRNAISGTKATTLRFEGEEKEVIVKYALSDDPDKQNEATIGDLESLTIATSRGDIPVSAFTTTDLSGAAPVIRHENGERILNVTAQVSQGIAPVQVFAQVDDIDDDIIVPPGYTVNMGGETEDIDESFMDMYRAMFLALFLIASALVLQFNSFRQPLLILVTIPLALIGVFPGLVAIGLPLSFPGIIGILALIGIVVNNAIILIDRINRHRRDGKMLRESVVLASISRLEPILLTTITTVLGLLPITLTNPLWAPLGWSIIFGLSFSTILTLIIIPMLYLKFAERNLND